MQLDDAVAGLRAEEGVDAERADAEVVAHRAPVQRRVARVGRARDLVERDDHRRTCAARSPSSSTTPLVGDERVGDAAPLRTSSAATMRPVELADEALAGGQLALVERGEAGDRAARRRREARRMSTGAPSPADVRRRAARRPARGSRGSANVAGWNMDGSLRRACV